MTLPMIHQKETFHDHRIKLPAAVHNQVVKFTEFYQSETGVKPEITETIIALVRDYLIKHHEFNKYLRSLDKGNSRRRGRTAAVPAEEVRKQVEHAD